MTTRRNPAVARPVRATARVARPTRERARLARPVNEWPMVGGFALAPETEAWLARLSTPPSRANQLAVDRWVKSGKAEGWLAKLVAFYPFALVADAADARVNLISSALGLTEFGTADWIAGQGWAGDGATGYLSPGVPWGSIAGIGLNDFETGVYSLTDVSNAAFRDGGAVTGSELFWNGRSTTVMALRAASATGANISLFAGIQDSLGLYGMSRAESAKFKARKNGLTIGESSIASTAFPVGNATLGRGAAAYSSRRFALWFIAAAMTDAQYQDFYFATGRMLAAAGVVAWGAAVSTESLEARAPLTYWTRDGTKMRASDEPMLIAYTTGNSRSVGSQGALGSQVETTSPPAASAYAGMMFQAQSIAQGTRGNQNGTLTAASVLDVQAAYEQAWTGTQVGETHVTACLARLVADGDAAGDAVRVFLGRTHGAAGDLISEVVKGTQPYANGLLETTMAIYVARHYGFARGAAVRVHSVMWIGGDQDRTADLSASAVETALKQLADDYDTDHRAITGQSEPILFMVVPLSTKAQAVSGVPTPQTGHPVTLGIVAAARNHTRIRIPCPAYVLDHDASGTPGDDDDLHHTPAAYQLLGRYQAHVIREDLAGREWVAVGQSITVTRSGAQVEIVFWADRAKTAPRNNLEILADHPLLEPITNAGFAWKDDSASATIASVAVVSRGTGTNNAVLITLTATPTGANGRIECAYDGPGSANHSGSWSTLGVRDDAVTAHMCIPFQEYC